MFMLSPVSINYVKYKYGAYLTCLLPLKTNPAMHNILTNNNKHVKGAYLLVNFVQVLILVTKGSGGVQPYEFQCSIMVKFITTLDTVIILRQIITNSSG